ncbi:MAG: acyl-CoA/acyl-ACP dehydrogenase [Gammaproteobacteria bacterium]|jgi:alkylation response protein AidB-like acyl-CoA dehydrogenase|nr:acyl-CoA/acyl-ACP dehydrogenase [Gammaproteobacteria bacterium]MBP6053444.1 acyl-CoA/acyl-ACP dehydrogenase [Pseudomonadales bacterium]MBK6582141.1 acyl-CoA/acyl-ACP dehydrogenase [Gammaproteobacteria bacterium]MBK7729359.1 acyl-CoA/acyl-ACP dehydrogenase [Gammaproteobacteria bacterium]MBK9668225.1 acyl-CoA/acyl-ACP dehydrogenase [Gammaproteobacteria bacterium]
MSMPKDFGFGAEELMLRDAARKFFRTNFPTDRLHRLVAGDPEPNRSPECLWDRDLWAQLTELGWTALAVPERAGGIGMSCVAVAALVEEAGRAAFPSPLLATIHATYVLDACASADADTTLAEIGAGATATLVITNDRGGWNDEVAGVRECDGRLDGSAFYVQDAAKADLLVVKARGAQGCGLYLVRAQADGVTITADSIVDLTRDQAHIRLENVRAERVLAAPGTALAAITKAEPALFSVLAADMCGAAEWQLQATVEYAKVRQQFEHALGFFQAVKHPLVNVMIQIDQARSHVYNAACTVDHQPAYAARAAHMAKAAASDAAAYASSRSVQFHGGIGFTWECFVHLYFKRQLHNQMLFGDAGYHRGRLAALLLG